MSPADPTALPALLGEVDGKHWQDRTDAGGDHIYMLDNCAKCGEDWPCAEVRLAAAVREMARDSERLERFVGAVMEEHRHDGEPGDVDGGTLQDMAVAHGLLKEVTVTAPCDPDLCVCAEYGDFPLTCYRNTELMQRCVRAALLTEPVALTTPTPPEAK